MTPPISDLPHDKRATLIRGHKPRISLIDNFRPQSTPPQPVRRSPNRLISAFANISLLRNVQRQHWQEDPLGHRRCGDPRVHHQPAQEGMLKKPRNPKKPDLRRPSRRNKEIKQNGQRTQKLRKRKTFFWELTRIENMCACGFSKLLPK